MSEYQSVLEMRWDQRLPLECHQDQKQIGKGASFSLCASVLYKGLCLHQSEISLENIAVLARRSADFFCKGPDSQYFSFCSQAASVANTQLFAV